MIYFLLRSDKSIFVLKEDLNMSEEVKEILLNLNIGCNSFFCFLDGKVKSYDLGGDDTIYGCMTLTDNDGIIRDIRVLVLKIRNPL